jgi:hypothetical protein
MTQPSRSCGTLVCVRESFPDPKRKFDHDPGTDRAEVWQRVRAGLADLLRANGCGGVRLRLATEPPQVNPRSGKLRHVLRSVPPAADEDVADRRSYLV